jgi:hypothetical protein
MVKQSLETSNFRVCNIVTDKIKAARNSRIFLCNRSRQCFTGEYSLSFYYMVNFQRLQNRI